MTARCREVCSPRPPSAPCSRRGPRRCLITTSTAARRCSPARAGRPAAWPHARGPSAPRPPGAPSRCSQLHLSASIRSGRSSPIQLFDPLELHIARAPPVDHPHPARQAALARARVHNCAAPGAAGGVPGRDHRPLCLELAQDAVDRGRISLRRSGPSHSPGRAGGSRAPRPRAERVEHGRLHQPREPRCDDLLKFSAPSSSHSR